MMLEALAKWSKERLIWTLTIGYLVTLEILSWIASHVPPCVLPSQIEGQSTSAENQNCPAFHAVFGLIGGFIDEHEGAFTVLGTLAIAVFTWTLWRSTSQLWRVTSETLTHAQETSQRQLRAYITLKAAELASTDLPFNDDVIVQVKTVWENTGQTPSRKTRMYNDFAVFSGDLPPEFDFPIDPQRKSYRMDIGPRDVADFEGPPIGQSLLKQIAEKKFRLFIWGWIEYNDVFADTPRHRTEFCAEVRVVGFAGQRNCIYPTEPHERHNGWDDSCSKMPMTKD